MTEASGNGSSRRLTGGRVLAEMLQAHGVGPMFGMAGFQLMPFYNAVRELGLTHHLVNDERGAACAADAYARVSGRPGVCDATLGPGATNLVTGLVESLNAGVPQVVLTGDAHRAFAWRNMTQEARQVEILRPAVKELLRVERLERLPELVRRAFSVATSGRPGPVVLDIPEDVCHGEADFPEAELYPDPAAGTCPSRRCRPDQADVLRAAALLAKAKRPLILAGGGVHLSQAYEALLELAEAQAIPVAHTISGKGALACVHPLAVGLFGRYSRVANDLLAQADLLLAVGCKLGEIATRRYQLLPPATPLVHLDVVPEEIGRTARPSVALWGDARLGLEDLAAALAQGAAQTRRAREGYLAEIEERRSRWLTEARPRLMSDERPINLARLIHELNRIMPADSILVADGGFAGHWTGLLYDTKLSGRHYVANRGFASIGYGLPGGLGAKLAAPEKAVVALAGDAGSLMMLGELETARRAGATFTAIVVNNAASGYVKALQHAMFGGRYQSADLSELDFAQVARAMGCLGLRVEDPADLAGAIETGLANAATPTVIDVVVTRDPARMLPGVDARAMTVQKDDRPA